MMKSVSLAHKHPVRYNRSAKLVVKASKMTAKSIGIIGAGGVGSAIASSIIHRNIVNEICINDMNTEMCKGVVYDLEDEAYVTGTHIRHAVSVKDLNHCDIIVITAGARQKPDEPRTELIERNVVILKSILTSLYPIKEDAIILLVTNPVDVLTSIVQEWFKNVIPREKIIGSGTYLDTQRARVALSKVLNVSVKSVHAYILGEHGDSQVFAKSASRIGGAPLTNFEELTYDVLQDVENTARHKAYEIIKRKGATAHGIGECVASICETVILDKNEVMPVSSFHPNFGTCVGWPAVVGAKGVQRILPIDIDKEDEQLVKHSANVIKSISDDITTRISLFKEIQT